jgi:hypothetical protein
LSMTGRATLNRQLSIAAQIREGKLHADKKNRSAREPGTKDHPLG